MVFSKSKYIVKEWLFRRGKNYILYRYEVKEFWKNKCYIYEWVVMDIYLWNIFYVLGIVVGNEDKKDVSFKGIIFW